MDKKRIKEIESSLDGIGVYITRQLKLTHSIEFINRIMKKVEVIRTLSVEYGMIVGSAKAAKKLALQEDKIYRQEKKIEKLEKELERLNKKCLRLQKNTTLR